MQTIGVLATYATQNTIYLRRHYAGLNTTGDLHRIASHLQASQRVEVRERK